jgi:ankyrin repeat protein
MLGKLEEVRGAIAQGIDVNALGSNGCTALMYAANYGHIPVIQALLRAGADPNILSDDDIGLGKGKTALMLATESFFNKKNRREIVKLLSGSSGHDLLTGES